MGGCVRVIEDVTLELEKKVREIFADCDFNDERWLIQRKRRYLPSREPLLTTLAPDALGRTNRLMG